jgi:DUF2075 family protein
LEIDYVGVIIGPDLLIRDGKVVTDPSKRASYLQGYDDSANHQHSC